MPVPGTPASVLAMLPRERRLTKGADFVAVARHGRVAASRCLVLRARRNDAPSTRFGFAVSKAVGGAVVRNRVKRRLREVLRSGAVFHGWDVVISARPPAAKATFSELEAETHLLLRRAGLSRQEPRR